MNATDIKNALAKVPFQPFEISLVNGQTFRVAHPDCFLFNRRQSSCVLAEGDYFRFFDLDHVSSLGLKPNARRRPRKRARP